MLKNPPGGGFRAGWCRSALRFGGTPIRYPIMDDAVVDSPARAHKRIVDNAPSPRPNGGVAHSLDEAKAAFRGMQPVASIPRLIEILQVRRLLGLASGHQVAISAQVMVLVAN